MTVAGSKNESLILKRIDITSKIYHLILYKRKILKQ